jgi:16S rRNA (adenine1518-N6/adenine1519-N6)-dimethyltransferase
MMDQHFMTDSRIIGRIVAAARIRKDETVLEIGAGRGSLTRELAKAAGKVIAIEIDRRLESELLDSLAGRDNVELMFGNALKVMRSRELDFDKMVSNIPYAICEPLMQELAFMDFRSAILTLPVRFAARLSAEPGDRDFGTPSMIARSFFDAEELFEIPKWAFDPMPKTASRAVLLRPGDRKSLLCRVLLRRRMKLKNAIMRGLFESRGYTKNHARKTIKSFEINNLLDKKMSELGKGELKTVWSKLQKP